MGMPCHFISMSADKPDRRCKARKSCQVYENITFIVTHNLVIAIAVQNKGEGRGDSWMDYLQVKAPSIYNVVRTRTSYVKGPLSPLVMYAVS